MSSSRLLPNRRQFLALGAAVAALPVRALAKPDSMDVIDYGRSFLVGKIPANEVRFSVESRTRVIDERSGKHEDFYQCASCKAEATFADKNLFRPDNYDFLPIFGTEGGVIFRRKSWLNPDYRTLKKAAEMWGGQEYKITAPKNARLLTSNAEIRAATHAALPIVAQTELADASTGMRAIIEYPVKTMNTHREKDMYQIDTGPVAFPDLTKRYDSFAESLALAFVAFNVPHFADFVIEDVTPIKDAGKEVARVRHFERIVSLSAANRLYAIEI
ncbi:MAG TPA: hypothetical protein VD994_17450 [Prosthecobacter sp.]|nr:hypothetical protein [Prosthecobacter sp.]